MASKDKQQNIIRILRCFFVLAASTTLLCSEMPPTRKNRKDIQNTQPTPSSSIQALHATEQQGVLMQVLKKFNSAINAEENEHLSKRQRPPQKNMALKPNPVLEHRIKKKCNNISNELYGASTSMAPYATLATEKNDDKMPLLKTLETRLQRFKEKYPLNLNEESENMSHVKLIHTQIESLIKKKVGLSIDAIHQGIAKLLEKLLEHDIPRKAEQFKEEKKIIKTHCFNSNILSEEAIHGRVSLYLYNSDTLVATSFMPDIGPPNIKPSLKCIQEYITSNMQQQSTYDQKLKLLKLNKLIENERMITIVLELGEILIKLITEDVINQGLVKYFFELCPNNIWSISNQFYSYNKLLNIAYLVRNIIYDTSTNNYTDTELFDSLDIAKTQLSIYNLRILGYIIYWEIIHTNASLYYFKEVPANTSYATYNYTYCMLPEEFMMYSKSAHLPRINAYNPIKITEHSAIIRSDYKYNPFKSSGVLYVLLSKYIDKFIISDNDVLRKQFLYLSCQLPAPVRLELIDLLTFKKTLEAKLLIVLHIASANLNQPKLIPVLYIPKYIMTPATS
ncbi:hypothetical protein NEFER03_2135 [Nematocida sp. LUAm3]|nr:hypothetical protein NEFER03_2135 [Nematocida sp. LUAm3]KAI5174606.1 hypothetical protein NEFER02_0727 [Nematocida sp. LUAm2]KAI5177988.1 hypothetical protein NEFER01_1170 [Nematocida sp. LUAm1]